MRTKERVRRRIGRRRRRIGRRRADSDQIWLGVRVRARVWVMVRVVVGKS